MWSRPACQTLSKALDISSATARVAPDLLKALAILSDTTVRRSAVDREDLNHIGSQKKGHVSLDDQNSYYLQVFQTINHRKKTNRAVVFSCRPFPNILKYKDHLRNWKTPMKLPTIWKTRLLKTYSLPIDEFS